MVYKETMTYTNKDILSADQFTHRSLEDIFSWARRMRPIKDKEVNCNVMSKYTLGIHFFEESTRTRLSSERAFSLLGGRISTMTDMKYSSMVKGESFADCIRTLSSFCDIMVVRCIEEGQAAIAAKHSSVPVINGGDGKGEHPTQALLDVFTISEERQGKIDGLTIAIVGDLEHSRTAHSLIKLLTLYKNITFICVAPAEFELPQKYRDLIKARHHIYKKVDDLPTALKKADVVYMIRPQNERMDEAKQKIINNRYRLTKALIQKHCHKTCIIMHPMPRNQEIATNVDSLHQAAYFRAIDNGILVRMALFVLVLGKQSKFI